MASNIAVKVTADVVDLRAKMAIASAEVRNTAGEMNKLAKEAASNGLSGQLNPQLLKAAEASVQATAKLKGLRQEVEQLGGGGGGHGAISTATREFRALFDELTSGRTQNTPGTLAIIGQRVFNLGPMALAAVGGIGLLAAGLGYLAIEGIKAAAAIDKISLSGLGTQGFAATEQEIGKLIDQVKKMGNLGREDAEKIVGSFATMQNRSQASLQALSLATVGWAQLTGQETDKASEQLSKVFGAPMNAQAREFVTSLRGVSVAQLDAFDKAVKAGDVYAAQRAILATLNNTIQQSNGRLAEHAVAIGTSYTNLAKYITLVAGGMTPQQAHIALLEEETAKWKGLQGAIAGATAALANEQKTPLQSLTQALLDAKAVDATGTRIDELKVKIAEFKREAASPLATEEMKKQFASATRAAETELKSLQDKKAFGGTGFSNAGDKAIAEARATISEINADQTKGEAERRAAIQSTYDDLLKTTKLNAAQRLEVEKSRNDAIAQANRQAANEKRQLDQSTAQSEERIAQVSFNAQRQGIQEQVAAGRITKIQGLQQTLVLVDQETQARLDAVAKAEQGYSQDTLFFKQKELEKKLIVAESEAEKAAIRRQIEQQSAEDSRRIWRQAEQQIMSAEQTFTQQLFSGRVGLFGSLKAAGLQFAQSEVQQLLKGMTERLLLKKEELAQDQTLGQLGILGHILFEGQKTAATAAGETARLSTKEAARSAGSAADLASGSAQIINDASKAGAGAYAAVAGIPIVGPILAPIAAGTAFAAVAAFDTLTALDTGTNYVPRDMPALIHEGERVVPAADNRAMLAALQGGAANQNGGMEFHFHEAPGSKVSGREKARDMIDEFKHARRIGKIK